ncbi:hypothetical protein BGZ94_009112 [Podila epigama]|nr:hypothetical protein BGZ94_009112 [Podila epigama]
MVSLYTSIVGAITLTLAAAPFLTQVHAQVVLCGGVAGPVNGAFFSYQPMNTFGVLSMWDDGHSKNESYVLHCSPEKPESFALVPFPAAQGAEFFHIPLKKVMVAENYTSSYFELLGTNWDTTIILDTITILEDPQDIVSPCLQQRFLSGQITAVDASNYANQYAAIDAAFRQDQDLAQPKDIWMRHAIDIEPLARAEYIKAVSFFFDAGLEGIKIYDRIKGVYETHKNNLATLNANNKKRVAWLYYDFGLKRWKLRNSKFTRAIITDAGGIPARIGDSEQDDTFIDQNLVKGLMLDAHVIIDQTEFPKSILPIKQLETWKELAGFQAGEAFTATRRVFTLDHTVSPQGISDYKFRVAARPDLLLRDVIRAMYPGYGQNEEQSFTFLHSGFGYGGLAPRTYRPEDCAKNDYNNGDIKTFPVLMYVEQALTEPPTSVYFGGSNEEKPFSKVGIIVGVIVAATVMSSAFAFAFFRWGKRAKEDRFIELEEEMNNEIPLH